MSFTAGRVVRQVLESVDSRWSQRPSCPSLWWCDFPTLGFPLTEARLPPDTTAFTAVLYAREGIDLLHPMVPIFGPPWFLPFEFQQ